MGIVRTSILGRPGRLSAHCSSSVNAAHTLTCEEPSSPTTRRGVVIDQLDGPACLDSPSSVRHLVSVSESHPFFPGNPPGFTESDSSIATHQTSGVHAPRARRPRQLRTLAFLVPGRTGSRGLRLSQCYSRPPRQA